MKLLITDFDLGKSSFQNDYRSLPADIKESFKERFKMLLDEPKPKKLRLEKLSGYKRPGIYTIHITSNHSHKLSFELVGTIAVLRRIGTHKDIDRKP